jgi:hypothetical protein
VENMRDKKGEAADKIHSKKVIQFIPQKQA